MWILTSLFVMLWFMASLKTSLVLPLQGTELTEIIILYLYKFELFQLEYRMISKLLFYFTYGRWAGILLIFKHNFCFKPYLPREPRRDPSNRRLFMNIWYMSDTTRNRTNSLFRFKCAPIPLGLSTSIIMMYKPLKWIRSIYRIEVHSVIECGSPFFRS